MINKFLKFFFRAVSNSIFCATQLECLIKFQDMNYSVHEEPTVTTTVVQSRNLRDNHTHPYIHIYPRRGETFGVPANP